MKEQNVIKSIYFSIIGNALLAFLKFFIGVFGNSQALIADAIESTSDVFSSILILLGLKYSARPADENHPYGHGRIEPLFTFIIVGFLITSAIIIGFQSILNIQNPNKEIPETFTLYFLIAIIIWKEFSYRWMLKKSTEADSNILKADAWHHRSDALTSFAALIGISIALFMGDGYEIADDIAALLACAVLIYNSYKILRPALGEIMDEHLYHELVDLIHEKSAMVEGIIDTEKCYIRKTGMKYHVDLHARVNGEISVKEGHDIAHNLKDFLKEQIPSLGEVLIHIEPK